MSKLFRAVLCLFAVTAVATVAACSSSSGPDSASSDVSKFVGLWHMSLKSDASDPGFDWRFNADNTVVLYNTGSTAAKGTGSCTITGQTSTGTWTVDSANKGTFTSTLTGDDSLDFNFIEEKYSPAKTFVYVGSRLEAAPAGSTTTTTITTTTSAAGTDELDPSLVTWDCPAGDVGKWGINSKITAYSISKDTISIQRNPDDNWPTNSSSKPSVGNWWIIGKYNGAWYGATVDWIGVGRTETGTPGWDGNDGLNSTLNSWRPVSGETAYLMQSTHARNGVEIPGNTHRTNIVKVKMP